MAIASKDSLQNGFNMYGGCRQKCILVYRAALELAVGGGPVYRPCPEDGLLLHDGVSQLLVTALAFEGTCSTLKCACLLQLSWMGCWGHFSCKGSIAMGTVPLC